MDKRKNRTVVCLFLIVFMLSVPFLFTSNYNNFDNDINLETSATNTLFNGKSYPFELKDIYDDENYTKIYTDAYLQTEYNQNGTIFNDTISVVNNTCYKSPSNTDITMINGTFDNSNNMKANDDSNSEFTSIERTDNYTGTYSFEDEIVGDEGTDIDFIDRYDSSGGSAYARIESSYQEHNMVLKLYDGTTSGNYNFHAWHDFASPIEYGTVEFWTASTSYPLDQTGANWGFSDDDGAGGYTAWLFSFTMDRDNLGKIEFYDGGVTHEWGGLYVDNTWFHVRIDFETTAGGYLGLGVNEYNFWFDEVLKRDAETLATPVALEQIQFNSHGYDNRRHDYMDAMGFSWDPNYEVGDNLNTVDLNFNIDLDFSELDTSNLLAVDVESHHYTNISQTIVGNIYNYDSGTYTEMFSSSNTAETENYFVDNTSISDYLDVSGNLKLQFKGIDSENDFKLLIDYIKVKFYYKMDITIDKTFYINGFWRYRFKLIGSLHYTDWTPFEVIDPTPNFYAISESDLTTRWILQNASLTAVEDFHDDINTDYWDLVDVSENYFTDWTTEALNYLLDNSSFLDEFQYTGVHFDTGTEDVVSQGIEWDGTHFWVITAFSDDAYKYTATGVYTGISFDTTPQTTYPSGITWDGTYFWVIGHNADKAFKYFSNGTYTGTWFSVAGEDGWCQGIEWDGTNFWVIGGTNKVVYKYTADGVYTGTSFSLGGETDIPKGITWDGTYFWIVCYTNNEVYKYTSAGVYTGVHFDTSSQDSMSNGITWDGNYLFLIGSSTTEVYKYENKHNISKNYFGSGYMYMQTDITESISLKSKDYGTHKTLNSGDYFEVDFQTSSDSQINLILLNDSIVQKTLILSQSGNTNFGRHTAKISVSEFVEFDQLKISSTFEDKDNVKIYDVKTYKYTITGDYADFIVGSKRDYEVYLTPDVYNLKISDYNTGLNLENINVTIPNTGVKQHVFTPVPTHQCRIVFFNPQNAPLTFTDYHVYINRSLGSSYSPFTLLENIFSVDVNTMVYIEIKDRFNTLIRNYEKLITPTTDYLDIELQVYSLQVKNLMEQKTTLTVNSTLYTHPLLSGDSIYFMLSEAHYVIGYYDTNNVDKQFTIYLNSNQAYELNRSKICFLSYADQQGNHLFFENYKTYLNGSLIYENIFYREIGDIVGIEIKDRYDISIKNETYTVISGDNYIPITLTMYSLKIMNQQEIFNWINITRDPNYYESSMYWSEWIAPTEIIEFKLFAGYYKINLTDNENSGSSYYSYTLNGDDILLISSGNTISNLIINIANVNSTIGNQITNVQIDLSNQNSEINNTIINIEINLSNVNSSLGNLLVDLNLGITNIANNISSLYVFTNNSFLNLDNQINNSFIYMENNIISINQSVSTLIIGLDGKISIVNATINTMWTEMSNQFIVTQSTLNFSFAFLNQTIVQIGNNITENTIALQNLIIQRANEIDNSLIQISTLVNLINSSVVNESLVIQSLVNIIGNNITENHVIINDLINLIGNNITENNINMVSLIELTGNNITTNQFVIQTLIDFVSNNITENHLEFLTNINLINNTIGQNQIELINRLLFINNSINEMALDLTNQILLVNNTIYSAILDVYTSIEFNSDNILGNISLTYQQNDFLTELYKETMFSQLLNWSDVAFNYSLMESRVDVWEFINNYKNQSIEVHLRYQDIIDNLTITAQNSISQYLPKYDTDYNSWSVEDQEYLDEWQPLPENKTVNFGFYETEVPIVPRPLEADFITVVAFALIIATVSIIFVISWAYIKKDRDVVPEDTRLIHKRKRKARVDRRKGFYDHT